MSRSVQPTRHVAAKRQFLRGTAMAWLLQVGMASGCLLPAPDEELDPVPNQPPRIDTSNITPGISEGPTVMTTNCTSYLFFAGLSDPDPNDTLYWRVFLDYYRQLPGTLLATETRTAKPGTVINFSVDPSDPRFFVSGSLTSLHLVELLVADRPFDDTPRQPYARNTTEPGITDSFVWAIDLNNTDPCVTGAAP